MKFKLAAAGMLALLVQAPHAFAGIGTLTYYGVVDNAPSPDIDSADLFGGGDLSGDLVAATLTYDTAVGIHQTDGASFDYLYGGTAYGVASPLLSVAFTVYTRSLNAYSYSFTPDDYVNLATDSSYNYIEDFAISTANDNLGVYINTDALAPSGLSQTFSGTGYGPGSYFLPGATNTGILDSITFDTIYATVSYVPEPGAWTLMIAGLGLVGAMARFGERRRVATT